MGVVVEEMGGEEARKALYLCIDTSWNVATCMSGDLLVS